jgi:isopentenyl diphosphate isomerase/L-lactate dehydrogenase-like FMN-dependent dehydrogenase
MPTDWLQTGEAGVSRALEILREDVDRTLRLLGCRSALDLSSDYVEYPPEWRRRLGERS